MDAVVGDARGVAHRPLGEQGGTGIHADQSAVPVDGVHPALDVGVVVSLASSNALPALLVHARTLHGVVPLVAHVEHDFLAASAHARAHQDERLVEPAFVGLEAERDILGDLDADTARLRPHTTTWTSSACSRQNIDNAPPAVVAHGRIFDGMLLSVVPIENNALPPPPHVGDHSDERPVALAPDDLDTERETLDDLDIERDVWADREMERQAQARDEEEFAAVGNVPHPLMCGHERVTLSHEPKKEIASLVPDESYWARDRTNGDA